MKSENDKDTGRADGQHGSNRLQLQKSRVFDGRLNGSLSDDLANRAEGLWRLRWVGPGPSSTYIRRVFQNVRA
jgi:hypothetical protein